MIVQLKVSEISIKKLFKDFLIELKGFKYQITLAVLLSKMKNSGEVEYSPGYFNTLTKTVINSNKFNWLGSIRNNQSVFKCQFLLTIEWKYLYYIARGIKSSKKRTDQN